MVEVCSFNKFGFCKFQKNCRKMHEDNKCEILNCDIVSCVNRHPKVCKYFREYNMCKFGTFCHYVHKFIEKEPHNSEVVHKIKLLEIDAKIKDSEIISLKEKMINLEFLMNRLSEDLYKVVSDSSEIICLENSKDDKNDVIEDEIADDIRNVSENVDDEDYPGRIPQIGRNAFIRNEDYLAQLWL